MTRTMYDAINVNSLPAGGDLYAGYVDGHWPDYSAIASKFGKDNTVGIATNPNDDNGTIGDGPPDNGTWPEWVAWTVRRRAAGVDPTINTNVSNWDAGKAAYASAKVAEPHWWIAHYDNDPTIPAGAVAKQYASNNLYDTSSVADYWPGVDPVPTPPPVTTSEEDDMRLIQSPAGIWLLSGNLYVHIDNTSAVNSFTDAGVQTVHVDAAEHALLVAASSTPNAT